MSRHLRLRLAWLIARLLRLAPDNRVLVFTNNEPIPTDERNAPLTVHSFDLLLDHYCPTADDQGAVAIGVFVGLGHDNQNLQIPLSAVAVYSNNCLMFSLRAELVPEVMAVLKEHGVTPVDQQIKGM